MDRIADLDLEPIIVKAMSSKDEGGLELSLETTKLLAEEYRKFLILSRDNPGKTVVPSSLIDKFWHLHILDTQKYQKDCDVYLGVFLHHFPYFGMRGEEDARNLKVASQETLDLYRETFGRCERDELWQGSGRCPNCGVRCRSQWLPVEQDRPRLRDLEQVA